MRYIWLIGVLLFLGCGPKYRVMVATVVPEDPGQQACIQECAQQRSVCADICRANFEICRKKADAAAQKAYNKAMERYTAQLEQYAKDLERIQWEGSLYYGYGSCYGDPFGCGPYGGWGIWGPPYPYLGLAKPRKPDLERFKTRMQMQMCRIDCGCQTRYLECFTKCGGKVIRTKKCVANCPDGDAKK